MSMAYDAQLMNKRKLRNSLLLPSHPVEVVPKR